MRPELPPPIVRAIEACTTATLVFDRARLATNFAALAAAGRAHGITTLFAMKSFPVAEVWALARDGLDGLDVATQAEAVAAEGARVISVADPAGRARARGARVIASCETVAQVATAPRGAAIAIRLSVSAGGRDPAIGAILDGSGHRRSRFGLDVAPAARTAAIRELVRAAGGAPIGLHVHHGAVTPTSPARVVATATDALASAHAADLEPAFLNLGGAWHGLADLPAAFAAVRAAIPRAIEILVEPGRLVADGAGFATGRVMVTRRLDDRALCVTELSRSCHLRWSAVELVAPAPAAGDGVATVVVGPTCFEDDVLGEWTVAPAQFGDRTRVIVRGVTGYAVAWNSGFGTTPVADVVFV